MSALQTAREDKAGPVAGSLPAPVPVLFVEHSIGVSGSTVSLCTLLRHLDPERYTPCVVFARTGQRDYLMASGGSAIDARVVTWRNGLKATRWGRAFYEMALRRSAPLRRFLTGLLSVLDIALVVLPDTLRLYRLARGRGIALVHHNNGVEPRTVLLARLLRVPLVVYQRGAEWHSRTARILARMVTRFIANSGATRQDLLDLGVEPEGIRVVYPPVDLARFQPGVDAVRQRDEFGLADDAPCFGILGTLLAWKGHHVFLRAARLVLAEVPNARVFVIGEEPDPRKGYQDQLLRLAAELGIADRVVFTGFRADVPELMQLLQVVVHASVSPEPFGRVIAEAMAMGKPVVATNLGGPLEIIEDGATGYLVPADQPEEMAERIRHLLTHAELARSMGLRAHRAVEARFSAQAHAGLVEQVYVEALRRQWGRTMTRQRRLVRLFGLSLCAGALLLAPVAARATHDTDPKTKDVVISTDPAVNGRHLREALALGQDALVRLESPQAGEDLPAIHKTIDRMYRVVRLALHGLRERRKLLKFDDPILEYEVARTTKAWDTIRAPVDRYFNNPTPEVYIETAIRDLREAIALLRPVVAVMP